MGLMVKFTLAMLLLFVTAIALLAVFQAALIFPRQLVGPAPDLPSRAESLTLTRPDGTVLHGHRIAGRESSRPVILGFGGNAWNGAAVALFLHQIAPEHDVVTFHYRGYAPSTGTPSAAALLADALVIHDKVAQTATGGIVAVGFSIGSGVAAHVAGQRALEGVVLVTPFDSLRDVARMAFPWAPVNLLFRNDMEARQSLRKNSAPVSLILATRDEVIPPARAEALAQALPQARVTRIGAGHNDIYAHPGFATALRTALAR